MKNDNKKEIKQFKREDTSAEKDTFLDLCLSKTQNAVIIHAPSDFDILEKLKKYDAEPITLELNSIVDSSNISGKEYSEIIGKHSYSKNKDGLKQEFKPALWYTELLKKCEQEPNKNHILLIPNITQVPPSIHALFYDLIAHKSLVVGTDTKLPDNCSIVLTDAYEKCYYPLGEAILKLLDQIYYDFENTKENEIENE